jgi:uncharacterized protein YjiS (DUF1127 family)
MKIHCDTRNGGSMICASWTPSTPDAGHGRATIGARIVNAVGTAWRGYWTWRARKATILILRSLDRRTLRDIGVDLGEIDSLPRDAERRATWPWRSGGA